MFFFSSSARDKILAQMRAFFFPYYYFLSCPINLLYSPNPVSVTKTSPAWLTLKESDRSSFNSSEAGSLIPRNSSSGSSYCCRPLLCRCWHCKQTPHSAVIAAKYTSTNQLCHFHLGLLLGSLLRHNVTRRCVILFFFCWVWERLRNRLCKQTYRLGKRGGFKRTILSIACLKRSFCLKFHGIKINNNLFTNLY